MNDSYYSNNTHLESQIKIKIGKSYLSPVIENFSSPLKSCHLE